MIRYFGKKRQDARVELKDVSIVQAARFLVAMQSTWVNLTCDKIELSKGRKEIERELHAKIPPLLEIGGYIPHIDHSVPPDISLDNFRYYLERKRLLLEG